jgi:hypothetical protein
VELTANQTTSKLLFSALHRVDVALLLWRRHPGWLDLEEVHLGVDLPRSSAHAELRWLSEVGAVDRTKVERKVTYRARPADPFWAWLGSKAPLDPPTAASSAASTAVDVHV